MIERSLRWSRNGSRGGLLWIGDRRIRSERCITLHTVRSLGVKSLIATTMPHARGFDLVAGAIDASIAIHAAARQPPAQAVQLCSRPLSTNSINPQFHRHGVR